MAAYLDYLKLYVYLADVRTEITPDVIGNVRMQDFGVLGADMDDRVGNVGSLHFSLNDSTGKYTPGGPGALNNWDKGAQVEVELSYAGDIFLYKFYIHQIKPSSTLFDVETEVVALDWMHYATTMIIELQGVISNVRANEVLSQLVDLMPKPPGNTNFDTGNSVFLTSLDAVTVQTKLQDEFAKIALSELGYIYLIHDRTFSETLRFESWSSRSGLRSLAPVPLAEADSGFLLRNGGGGGFLLNHTGGKIILDEVSTALFDNTPIGADLVYGRSFTNRISMQANPRRLDSSPQILFKLDKSIAIGSGQTIEIRGTYADPFGGDPVNAQDWIDPVPTTDFLFNSAEDGSGSNLTASIIQTAIEFGTEGFVHTVSNASTSAGWMTKYNVRAYGIYYYNPITHVEEDQVSIEEFGSSSKTINQKYQSNLYLARVFARTEVARNKDPLTILESVSFVASSSASLMTSFLHLQPGALVRIKLDKYGIDGHYYIQGIEDIEITPGGVIFFTYRVKEQFSYASGSLTPISLEFNGSNTIDGLFFEYLPHTANVQQRTYAFWIKRTDEPAGSDCFHFGGVTDFNGIGCYGHNASAKAGFWVKTTGVQGTWEATTPPLTDGQWKHIVWTYDTATLTTAPKLYVNGANVAVTQIGSAPTGAVADETDVPFSIGNLRTATYQYLGSMKGQIKDARMYNRILTAAEVTTLYNSGTVNPAVLATEDVGMIFQGSFIYTSEYNDLLNNSFEEDGFIVDNVYQAIGKHVGSPIIRSI